MIYTIRAAAMATGISESRLRTWERRYGIPRPTRTANGRRRFDEDDLSVIRRMVAFIEAGITASEAARAVTTETDVLTVDSVSPDRSHPLVDLLAQKALEFDDGWVLRIVRDSVFSSGWAATMERVVFPCLSRLSKQWGEARATMGHVRFAHELVRNEVAAEVSKRGPGPETAPRVVVACNEDDEYDIAALALTLLLREEELRIVYLGRGIPVNDLIEAVRQVRPEALAIVGTRRASPGALNRNARAVVASKLPVQLFVGGSVLTRRDAPDIPGIHLPQSLGSGAERIAKSLRRT